MYASQTKEYGIFFKVKIKYLYYKEINICLKQVDEYVKENHVSKLKSCTKTISFVLSIWIEHDFNSKAKNI